MPLRSVDVGHHGRGQHIRRRRRWVFPCAAGSVLLLYYCKCVGLFLGPGPRSSTRTTARADATAENKVLDVMAPQPSGEYCTLPEWDEDELMGRQRPEVPTDTYKFARDIVSSSIFYVLPFGGPCFAFWQWKNILGAVHGVIGEERQLLELTQVTLTPATNGIVVASLAIALGTLTSVTVSTLRQRQLAVRGCLNREACELALLQAALTASLGPTRARPATKTFGGGSGSDNISSADLACYLQTLELLRGYAKRIYSESSSRADAGELQEQQIADTELMGILEACLASSGARGFTVYPIRDESTMRIIRLNDQRSERLAYLATAYPLIHWVILALLASSIALCFLIEVDQSEGRFLAERPEDSIRLRIVFTLMSGAFSGLTALCADLNDPFRGSFSVERSTRQFATMMQVLEMEILQVRLSTGCVRPDD